MISSPSRSRHGRSGESGIGWISLRTGKLTELPLTAHLVVAPVSLSG